MLLEGSFPQLVFECGGLIWWKIEELRLQELNLVERFFGGECGWRGLLAPPIDHMDWHPRSSSVEYEVCEVLEVALWDGELVVRVVVERTEDLSKVLRHRCMRHLFVQLCRRKRRWHDVFNA